MWRQHKYIIITLLPSITCTTGIDHLYTIYLPPLLTIKSTKALNSLPVRRSPFEGEFHFRLVHSEYYNERRHHFCHLNSASNHEQQIPYEIYQPTHLLDFDSVWDVVSICLILRRLFTARDLLREIKLLL